MNKAVNRGLIMILSVHLERINTARLFHWSLGWKWRENKDKPAWHPQQVATVWAEVESGRRPLLFYLFVHYIWWLALLPGKINELIVIMRFCLVSPLSRCETFFSKNSTNSNKRPLNFWHFFFLLPEAHLCASAATGESVRQFPTDAWNLAWSWSTSQ